MRVTNLCKITQIESWSVTISNPRGLVKIRGKNSDDLHILRKVRKDDGGGGGEEILGHLHFCPSRKMFAP